MRPTSSQVAGRSGLTYAPSLLKCVKCWVRMLLARARLTCSNDVLPGGGAASRDATAGWLLCAAPSRQPGGASLGEESNHPSEGEAVSLPSYETFADADAFSVCHVALREADADRLQQEEQLVFSTSTARFGEIRRSLRCNKITRFSC